MTVMGDAWMEGFSDVGSIPTRSIKKVPEAPVLFCINFYIFIVRIFNPRLF